MESEDFAPQVQIGLGGAVYVSGYHTAFGNTDNASISRLRADGNRDPAYSLGPSLPAPDKQAASLALLPDGQAYVSYFSGAFNGYYFSNLVRLSANGALDTSFRPSPELRVKLRLDAFDTIESPFGSVWPIAPGPNGGLYVFFGSGDAQTTVIANGNVQPLTVRADGTEDTNAPSLGFPTGEVIRDGSNNLQSGSTASIHRLAQTADGGFIILASVAPFPTSNSGAPYNYRLVKVRADGSPDPGFTSPPIISTRSPVLNYPQVFDPVTGFVLQPPGGFYYSPDQPVSSASLFSDGSVLLGGNFKVAGLPDPYSLARLNPDGTFDASFNPPSASNTAQPSRAAVITNARVAPDGKIWVLGRFDTFGGSPAPGVARLNPDGTLDNSFHLADAEYYDSFGDSADVVFAGSDTAYLVGTFRRPGEPIPFPITRLNIAPALQFTTAVSRKTHGGSGDFDINLPLTGEPGVECRNTGGNHSLVFTFSNPMASGQANLTSGAGKVAGSPTFTGNTMTVNLTGVSDEQKITVTLTGLTDTFAQSLPDTAVSVNILIGDTNGNKTVSASDIAQTKSQSGATANATNFRTDLNASGGVTASDIAQAKANSGHTLP
ncbi:MAG: hypothetical protein ABIR21_12240 [Chthoniobacterales bacterium]